MSIWQYSAAVNGYVQAHTPEKKNKMDDREADELAAWMGIQ